MKFNNKSRILLFSYSVGLLIVFFCSSTLQAQNVIVEYNTSMPSLFSGENPPVGIALLPILENTKISGISGQIYDKLTAKYGIHEKFVIYPYSTLEEQLGRRSINPEDLSTLNKLRETFDIRFVVYGSVIELTKNWFSLKVANTLNGAVVFEAEFRTGKAATDYYLYATPTMILIDKEKKIIAKPISIEELKKCF